MLCCLHAAAAAALRPSTKTQVTHSPRYLLYALTDYYLHTRGADGGLWL